MKKKAKYRIRNWSDYNRSLVGRGSLTFSIAEDLLASWIVAEKTGECRRAPRYTQAAIVAMARREVCLCTGGQTKLRVGCERFPTVESSVE